MLVYRVIPRGGGRKVRVGGKQVLKGRESREYVVVRSNLRTRHGEQTLIQLIRKVILSSLKAGEGGVSPRNQTVPKEITTADGGKKKERERAEEDRETLRNSPAGLTSTPEEGRVALLSRRGQRTAKLFLVFATF